MIVIGVISGIIVVWTMELCTSACSSLTVGHLVGFPSDDRKRRNVIDKVSLWQTAISHSVSEDSSSYSYLFKFNSDIPYTHSSFFTLLFHVILMFNFPGIYYIEY